MKFFWYHVKLFNLSCIYQTLKSYLTKHLCIHSQKNQDTGWQFNFYIYLKENYIGFSGIP